MSTVRTNAILDASGGNTATINSMTPTADSLQGFRNRIINGAMVIDQRNAGAAVTINSTDNTYTLDRWFSSGQLTDGVFTVQQDTVAPTGFTNSAKITVTTADASIGATQFYIFRQSIEGNNVADLGWGAAGAKTVTLSFWVRSSVTGTFGGVLQNATNTRNYPFTYTISSANTWEQKSATIAGDTTGTWGTGTGRGITVTFSLGAGTSSSATAGAWTGTSSIFGATGQTQLISTLNATWYITGVQLEVGSTATPFERRPYGTELALCQRYAIVYGRDQTYNEIGGTGFAFSTTQIDIPVAVPVQMRSTPTVSTSGSFQASDGAAATAITSISIITTQSSSLIASLRGVVASGLTAYRPYRIETNNSTTANVLLSAEL